MQLISPSLFSSNRIPFEALTGGRFMPGTRGPIGIQFGQQALHLFQAIRQHDKLLPKALLTASYPDDRTELMADGARLSRFLSTSLKAARVRGDHAVLCIPDHLLTLFHFDYRVGNSSDEQLIYTQALERLNAAPGDLIVDFLPVRSSGGDADARSALVACALTHEVESLLRVVEKTGVQVDAMEIGPVAIRRLIAALQRANQVEHVLTVNFGDTRSFIGVVSGRRIILDHEVDFGRDTLLGQIAEELDLSRDEVIRLTVRQGLAKQRFDSSEPGLFESADVRATMTAIVTPRLLAFSEEIRRAMRYTASQGRGAQIQQIYILGSLAQWPGMSAVLGQYFDVPLTILDPLSVLSPVSATPDACEKSTALAIAAGCALRGLIQ